MLTKGQVLSRHAYNASYLTKFLSRPIPHPPHFDRNITKPTMSQIPPVRSLSEPVVVVPTLPYVAAPTPQTALSGILKIDQQENIDGPEHKFQVNEQLLFEHEFHGSCYVSAHLQRLQHSIFGDSNIHGAGVMHVTFIAVTFVFHPSISLSHRFQSAIIEVTARSQSDEPLRFVKFAPHLVYGRISTESLKWTFSLGATVGVTKSPVSVAINPSMAHQKDKVLGTMMKIQGSTRSTPGLGHHKANRIPDTRLVWSLEENDQQMTGLPREFTFVFLVARPLKAKSVLKGKKHEHKQEKDVEAMNAPNKISMPKCLDHATTFTPMHIGIHVKPHISNVINGLPCPGEYEEALVADEVGQRLVVEHTHDADYFDSYAASSYFNFAKMPGNFEDLIELPGNAVTSVEPNVSDK